ncbi:MAG: glutamate--tRNA ligase [Candidatus Babeliaceae bacterium]|jgi:glutamyl-tRNA synthetase
MDKRDTRVRVRFAPSPTGHLHVGGLRSALFNWLFARHHGGSFLLRIEDTDKERSLPEYTNSITEALSWCSLISDEPIVIQSERAAEHVMVAQLMLKNGRAYKCYCTQEELQQRLGANAAEGLGYVKYDQACRNTEDRAGVPYVIRFKLPDTIQEVVFNDLVHGDIVFNLDTLDDFIIVRSDGTPMYNFVVVVDDASMNITHVIRGEDHISNTPKQILLYQACGFTVPQFAHVPMILGPQGNRLSKRDAATAALDYRRQGFLPEALCNYLVRLGWSHGDQEIFSMAEAISLFSLKEVGKKGAIFDMKKLEWLNGMYMRSYTAQDLLHKIQHNFNQNFVDRFHLWTQEQLCAAIDLYKERVKTLRELQDSLYILHDGPIIENLVDASRSLAQQVQVQQNMQMFEKKLMDISDFTKPALERVVQEMCHDQGCKISDIGQPVRVALTGVTSSPSFYDLMCILGKEETLNRLRMLQKA